MQISISVLFPFPHSNESNIIHKKLAILREVHWLIEYNDACKIFCMTLRPYFQVALNWKKNSERNIIRNQENEQTNKRKKAWTINSLCIFIHKTFWLFFFALFFFHLLLCHPILNIQKFMTLTKYDFINKSDMNNKKKKETEYSRFNRIPQNRR